MVCQACGGRLGGEVRFCPHCGVAIAPGVGFSGQPQRILVAPRVQQHLQTLGYLWCGYGVLRLVAGLVGMVFVHAIFFHQHFGDEMWPFHLPLAGAMVHAILVFTLLRSALSLFTGYSLLTRKPWGRTLAIVAAILTLIKPLLGTALGIFTLWVLAPAASALEYDAISEPS